MSDAPVITAPTKVPELIAKFLKARGVDRVFSLSGGHILPIWDALVAVGIRIIDVRHEAAAVHMAQAHSELTGQIGVAIATAGPGVTNAITGMANAQIAAVPVMVIGGARPQPQEYLPAFQDVSHVEMVKPITQYARTVHDARHVIREMDTALSFALGEYGRPGCVYIEFPTDILRHTAPAFHAKSEFFKSRRAPETTPDAEAIAAAVEVLKSAKRPMVLTGRGGLGATEALTDLLTAYPAAYLDTLESRGLIPFDHPLAVPALRAQVMGEADLVITVGNGLDYQVGYGSPAIFKNAKFLRIGNAPIDLRGSRRGEVELPGTPARSVAALAKAIRGQPTQLDKAWLEGLQGLNKEKQRKLQQTIDQAAPGNDGKMHPYTLLKAVREILEDDAIVVIDGGDILSFGRIALPVKTCLTPGPLGTIGIGTPYALAASLAFPNRQVVLITGDGSLGFNLMEMDTAVRHGARFMTVVSNNAAWNIEIYDQLTTYEGRVVGTKLRETDYAAAARALGMHGKRVEKVEDLKAALAEGLKNRPALIDVVVTNDAASPDGKAGLAWVPDRQALGGWDETERKLEEAT